MFFTSTAPTPYDLRFSLLGVPVRVSPVFWIIALLLGGDGEPAGALVWVGAVFFSVLVHELGHALTQRAFGGRPSIVLYALGGLAWAEGVRETWFRNVLIALAGPAAGFGLFGVVFGLATALGVPKSELGQLLVQHLLFINLVWSVLNLAPIWPLDGGHVLREVLVRVMQPTRGIVVSLWVSIAVAAGLTGLMVANRQPLWNIVLFGLLAYQSYQTLSNYRASRGLG